MKYLLGALVGYLLGSFPTGVVISRRKYGLDVREVGSGNIGATNVKRIFGWYAGLLTFLIDLTKALLALGAMRLFYPDSPWVLTVTGIFSVLGHCFSFVLGFKGGKGVATGLGCILFVEPLCAFISGSVYLIFLGISKISAVGSLTGLIACLVYLIWVCPPSSVSVLIGALCLIILTRHKENILRLKESWKQRSKTR